MKTYLLYGLFLSLTFTAVGQNETIEKLLKKCDNDYCFEAILKEIKTFDSFMETDNIPLILPLKLEEITLSSVYGQRFHPISKRIKKHQGIDFSAPLGTIVYAPADGQVYSVTRSNTGYGNKIVLKHAYGFQTLYAHLSYIYVKKGQDIIKHQVIGFVGNSGSSTASHLHYEIKKNKKNINPNIIIKYL